MEQGNNPIKKVASKLNPLSTNNIVYRKNHEVGSFIENQGRIVNFLAHVQEGKSFEEARDLVNEFLFDYSDITDFESDVMKRIMPFYTWLRKNTKLQIDQMISQPEKYGRFYRGMEAVEPDETEEQKRYKPDYLKDAFVPLGVCASTALGFLDDLAGVLGEGGGEEEEQDAGQKPGGSPEGLPHKESIHIRGPLPGNCGRRFLRAGPRKRERSQG
jgi:hypothetical protein